MATEECLDTMENGLGEEVGVFDCDDEDAQQIFQYSKKYQLTYQSLCLDSHGKKGSVKIEMCVSNLTSQEWNYDNEVKFEYVYLLFKFMLP